MNQIELQGQIERVTYTSEESGYTVARVKVRGERDLMTVVGNIMSPSPGEILVMRGRWINHPRFGNQFHVDSYQTRMPATEFGITKYLGSGLIKGIGPVMARRIVRCFGEETLTVIETSGQRLMEVEGIGKKRVAMILSAWEEQKEIREVMLFLQSHGVSSGYAAKIFKQYGNDAIAVVSDNPFRLAEDIFGIGFVTADRIAEKLGMEKNAPARIEAGILYVLHRLSDDGHTCYPYTDLVLKAMEILEQPRELVLDGVGACAASKKIILEDANEDLEHFVENNKRVFLAKYHFCEAGIAFRLKRLDRTVRTLRQIDVEKALAWVQGELTIELAGMQREAIKAALKRKLLVITGGPGTGKTTIINALLRIYSGLRARALLAAPTGRAAKRMSEATGHDAVTIHRMLSYSLQKGGFQKNEDNPLACDLLIVDEASMIDTVLMHHLLKAVPDSAILILVGDINQLPSVGAGNVLKDIIDSGVFCVTELDTIFRQAEKSSIVVNAHRVNNGLFPALNPVDGLQDFFFIHKQEPEDVLKVMIELVTNRIPAKFGYDPVDDIQVLSPMHRGLIGAGNLNQELQKALNPGGEGYRRGGSEFKVSDKVMQIRNNYEKEVYNGDIGRVRSIDFINQVLVVTMDHRDVAYGFSELDELVHAYAISVHKSQGSEYPAVVIPVVTQHYVLLQRNLIYTAMTRGRGLVVMVGTKKALAMAVKNNAIARRYTGLRQRF